VTPADVKRILDFHLAGITRPYYVEAAFYGGSFTALPESLQQALLAPAKQKFLAGNLDAVRLSTRPDCIDPKNLVHLKEAGVKLIELGAQSFDDRVLRQSGRGHTAADIVQAAGQVRDAGMDLGIQLMPGLPGDTTASLQQTLTAALALRPDVVRLYPTLVLRDTPLEKLWRRGSFLPLRLDTAVAVTAVMKLALERAGAQVIRTGLQSSPELDTGGTVLAGPYHPAFGELVENYIFAAMATDLFQAVGGLRGSVTLHHAPVDASKLRGQKNRNLCLWRRQYPSASIRLQADESPDILRLSVGSHDYKVTRREIRLTMP